MDPSVAILNVLTVRWSPALRGTGKRGAAALLPTNKTGLPRSCSGKVPNGVLLEVASTNRFNEGMKLMT